MAVLITAGKRQSALAFVVGVLGVLGVAGGTGCGTQGNAEALIDAWPRTPLRGFVLRDAEQPYALLRLGWDLDQPVVAPAQSGDAAGAPLQIWGRMSPRQEPEHGLLFRAGDAGSLRAAIERLAGDPSLFARLLPTPPLIPGEDSERSGPLLTAHPLCWRRQGPPPAGAARPRGPRRPGRSPGRRRGRTGAAACARRGRPGARR